MGAAGERGLRAARGAARRLPNLLGFARILAAPLVAWLLLGGQIAEAFWVFLIAGLSDAFDGEIARRLGVVTTFGAILDPAADKLLIGSGYLTAASVGLLPWWLAWLVVGRDVTILLIAGVTHLLRPNVVPMPLRIGKLSTGVQVAACSAALAAGAYGWPTDAVRDGLLALAAVLTSASGIAYALDWVRRVRRDVLSKRSRRQS